MDRIRDDFESNNAMVIPSRMMLINRDENPVVVWSDGSAVRDFGFSRDVAEGTIPQIYHGTQDNFANFASVFGTTIKEPVETLCSFLDFN